MDSQRGLTIAALETAIRVLQEQEQRMQSILSSSNSSPEIKAQAQGDLARTLAALARAVSDVNALKST